MKDISLNMAKGLLLILFVISECTSIPELGNFLAMFCLPALFMTIGSTFDSALLQNKTKFIKRCFRRIYIPFVVFALIFLIIHNLLSWVGIVSPDSLYTWNEGNQNAWSIVWNMSGFDEDMCKPYWIFRALFMGSVAYLAIYSLCKKLSYFTDEKEVRWTVVTICGVLVVWQVMSGVKVTGVDSGGYRELMALFFIACGALYNIYRNELHINWIWALVLLALFIGSYLLIPARLEVQANIFETLKLLLPAVTAFLLVDAFVSLFKNDNGIIQKSLNYVGRRFIYVFAFIVIGFKMASMLVIAFSSATWHELEKCNVVRVTEGFSLLDVLYILFGLGIPLLICLVVSKLDERYHMDFAKIVEFIVSLLKFILITLFKFVVLLFHFIVDLAKGIASVIKDFWKASNPKDD